MIKCYSFS